MRRSAAIATLLLVMWAAAAADPAVAPDDRTGSGAEVFHVPVEPRAPSAEVGHRAPSPAEQAKLERIGGLMAGPEPAPGAAANAPAPSGGDAGSSRDTSLMWSLVRVCVTLAILLGLVYLVQRYRGRILGFLGRAKLIAPAELGQVLGRVPLSPKASLYFVRTGGHVLIVGVTDSHIALLTELAEGELAADALPADEAPADPVQQPAFLRELRGRMGSGAAAKPVSERDIAELRSEVERLQKYIAENM